MTFRFFFVPWDLRSMVRLCQFCYDVVKSSSLGDPGFSHKLLEYALGPGHGPLVLKPMRFEPEAELSQRKNTRQNHIFPLFFFFPLIFLLLGSYYQIFWTREPRLVSVCIFLVLPLPGHLNSFLIPLTQPTCPDPMVNLYLHG